MHITKKLLDPNKVELNITASEADLSPIKVNTLKKLSPNLKLPGFRAGKVPLNLVEKNLDSQVLQTEFIDAAVNAMYQQALSQENLRPLANPEMNLNKFVPFTTLEIKLTVPIIGEVKLPDYKKIRLAKKPAKVEPGQINEVLKSLQERMSSRKPVERQAKNGDEAVIDFKGVDSRGMPVSGADATDYPLLLGSNSFIPGFEANLLGQKPGETKEFVVEFPADYSVKALQKQKVTFTVSLKTLNELSKPSLDDDFATKVGPFKDLANLKADIKKELTIEAETQANRAYEEEVIKQITAKSKLSVPVLLVDEQIDKMERDEKQNLIYRGQTWDEHLAAEGVTTEQHREQKRAAAEERVKIGIVLSELAEAEKVVVSREEFEARINQLKSQYTDPKTQEELAKPEVRQDILAQMMTEKTLQVVTSYAGAGK